MATSPGDSALVLSHISATIGAPPNWARWPGGWPDDIESALIDAVFSARAVYRSEYGRGIYSNLVSWRAGRDREDYSLRALLTEIDAAGIRPWACQFGNFQVSPGRAAHAPGGRSKAATVRQAAAVLVSLHVTRHGDVAADPVAVKEALRQVPGIGYATVNYFLMLLGAPGVKPDRMIHRFLREAAGHKFTNADAEQIITYAARQLATPAHELDHAIWRYESAVARGGHKS